MRRRKITLSTRKKKCSLPRRKKKPLSLLQQPGSFPFWDSVSGASLQDVWGAILHQEVDFSSPPADSLPSDARDLLRGLLERDPAKRTTAAAALAHPWLSASSLSSRCSRSAPGGDVVQRLQRFATHGRLKRVILTLIADELNRDAAEFSAAASLASSSSSAAAALGSSTPVPVGEGNSGGKNAPVLSSTAIAASASIAAASALFAALDRDGSGGVCTSELASGEWHFFFFFFSFPFF